MRPILPRFSAAVLTSLLAVAGIFSAVAAEFTIRKEADGIEIRIDGDLFTRYVTGDEETNKPYFYPVIGPTGKAMTRAYPMGDVEGEARDHVHQRSFWFGHQLIDDFDTWHEERTLVERAKGDAEKLAELKKKLGASLGASVHREVLEASADKDGAVLKVSTDYTDPSGTVAASDLRTFTFHLGPDGTRIIDVDIVFTGVGEEVVFADAKDAGLSLRVAHSLTVDAKQGGRIVMSDGSTDKEAWGKRAAWCDFNGPIEGERLGIAVLNHPSSFRHPTPWHARTYGLLTANPFGLKTVAGEEQEGAVTLKKGETFTLRHRVLFHAGDEKEADIAGAWKRYAETE